MAYIRHLLGSDEKVLITAKRHIFVLLGHFVKELLVLSALIAGWIIIHGYSGPEFFWIEIGIGAIALLLIGSMLIDWLRWNNETFYITNRRVIQTSGVLNKRVLDSSISKINDVITEQSFLGRLFDYGTIKILTATEEVINSVDKIARPLEFKKAMLGAKANLEPFAGSPQPVFSTSTSSTQLLQELSQLKEKNLITEQEYQEKRKEILKRM
jgi:uncharacterized membrane protein YdbT with pleckstrin-like domain